MDFRKLSPDRKRDWRDQSETRLFLREIRRRLGVESYAVRGNAALGNAARAAVSAGMCDAFEEALTLAGAKPGGDDEQGTDATEEADDGE